MAEYLAHSAQNGFPAQTYKDHVQGVQKRGIGYAKEAEEYYFKGDAEISNVVCVSARYHDLGKLEEENQKVQEIINSIIIFKEGKTYATLSACSKSSCKTGP